MYNSEFPSQRVDGVGLYTRLSFHIPHADTDIAMRYNGISMPYQIEDGSMRINVGTPTEKAKLQKVNANLLVGRQAVESAVACFTLRDFRLDQMPVPMGRPVSFGSIDNNGRPIKRTDFGSPLHQKELYQALTLIVDGNTGQMTFKGQPWRENEWVVLENSPFSAAVDYENDKFRFGAACILAMSKTSKLPEVSVLQIA